MTRKALPGPPSRADIARAKQAGLPDGITTGTTADGQHSVSIANCAELNPFKQYGGSRVAAFNSRVLRSTIGTVWVSNKEQEPGQMVASVAAALEAFKPTNEIEGMLAAQAVAMHFGAMECFRRSAIGEQPPDIASKLRKDGANLARGMADMLDALDRKRGKGPQVVRVERVVVHEGGQAIVGNVQPAGTGPAKGEG